MLDFIDITIIDFIDITLFAFLLYYLFNLVKGTLAINIFLGIVIVYIIWQFTKALEMRLLSNIFGSFIGAGFFALVVVFQEEIREFLLMLGRNSTMSSQKTILKLFEWKNKKVLPNTDKLVEVCRLLSIASTGGLIVVERFSPLEFVKRTGDRMDVEIDVNILVSLFQKNSPFHDGAVIISSNSIVATRVILPVSKNNQIPLNYGLRHRAAIGITEKTDALVLVISEETGKVSYIKSGAIVPFRSYKKLNELLLKDLSH